MARKSTAPRIGEQSAKWYPSVFASLNGGMEYCADDLKANGASSVLLDGVRAGLLPG